MHYTHTQTYPHLCIISGTSSHLFTANLHLPLNWLAVATHHSDTVVVHVHRRVPQAVLSVFSSPPIELSLSFSHYVQPPIALRFSCECARLTDSFLNWSDAVHTVLDLVLCFRERISKDANVCSPRITENAFEAVRGCVRLLFYCE